MAYLLRINAIDELRKTSLIVRSENEYTESYSELCSRDYRYPLILSCSTEAWQRNIALIFVRGFYLFIYICFPQCDTEDVGFTISSSTTIVLSAIASMLLIDRGSLSLHHS